MVKRKGAVSNLAPACKVGETGSVRTAVQVKNCVLNHGRGAELVRLAVLAPAFDTVVNTIPAPVLTAVELAALPKGCLIVDLASKPGGTDFAAARRLGHTALHALSLPTCCAPESAGEALARTVQAILQEREGTV